MEVGIGHALTGAACAAMLLISGAGVALASRRAGDAAVLLERCGGMLMLLGLALFGAALPFGP